MTTPLNREMVLARSAALPAFPRVIAEILTTIDDPDTNLNLIVRHIEHDPVVAGRVMALANTAAASRGREGGVRDVYTATSMVGLARIREIAVVASFIGFARDVAPAAMSGFWQHSVAVGVCAEEVASYATVRVSVASALIAGLMHDIGQLWLSRFEPAMFADVRRNALARNVGIDVVERERFGVDHSTIGAWLAEGWSLPETIVGAIASHHAADSQDSESGAANLAGMEALADNPLIAVVHVAEMLCNALDLAGRPENRVTRVSALACRLLGLSWGEEIRPLLGRIEGRARHAGVFFHELAG